MPYSSFSPSLRLSWALARVATAVVAYTKPTGKIVDNYKRSGQIAMAEENYTVARICYSRLVKLQGNRPDLLYQLALAEEGVDKINDEVSNRAYALMDELAPDPRPKSDNSPDLEDNKDGMWQAHLWKAQKYLDVQPPSQQSLIMAGFHYGKVIKSFQEENGQVGGENLAKIDLSITEEETEAEAPEEAGEDSEDGTDGEAEVRRSRVPGWAFVKAAAGLYDIHMKAGQLAEAQRFLPFAQQQPGREELGVIFQRSRMSKQPEAVRRELNVLKDGYTRILELNPGNTPVRLALAETYRILDDYNNAERVLVEGTKLGLKDEKDLHVALANLYTIQLQRLGRNIKPEMQLQLVQAILDHDPGNTYMLQRLLAMAEDGDSEGAKQSKELIAKVIASGPRNPIAPTFHMLRANYCFSKGEDEKARVHLEQAFKLNTQLPELANSYAWLVAISPPFDLQRALKLIDAVVETAPENPKYRDTRGQILTRMGKYEEALKDLEFAVQEMPNSRSVHRSLEYCYRNLGMKEKADEELKLAQSLDDDLTSLRMAQADKKLFGIPAFSTSDEPTSLADDERLELYERQIKTRKKEGEELETPKVEGLPPAATEDNNQPAGDAAGAMPEQPVSEGDSTNPESSETPEKPANEKPAAENADETQEEKPSVQPSGPASPGTDESAPLLPQNESSDPLPTP